MGGWVWTAAAENGGQKDRTVQMSESFTLTKARSFAIQMRLMVAITFDPLDAVSNS